MVTINENYLKLRASYLFSDIGKRVAAFKSKNPQAEVIRFGIGDVTRPLPRVCIEAFHKATDEMADAATFHGYDDGGVGYAFLREKIAKVDFQARGADISADEIFVSDGAKCDTSNFQELFSQNVKIAVPDPVYPVYVDTNVMAGMTGEFSGGRYKGLTYLECNAGNDFVPDLPKEKPDVIYLCFPNNPTGAVITKSRLAQWVEYARQNKSLILFDAAYIAFVRDPSLPQSIFEIEGAREVAVEFRSYSKTAGFTGPAAPIRSSRNHAWPLTQRALPMRSMRSGTGVIPRNSMAFVIWCSARQRRFIPPKARSKSGSLTITICAMPGSS